MKELILLESRKHNLIIATPYNKITPEMREKHRLSGYMYMDKKDIPFTKKFSLETSIFSEYSKEYMGCIIKTSLKSFNKKKQYLNKIPNNELKNIARKFLKNINDLDNISLKRLILGNESLEGDLYLGSFGELIFSNISAEGDAQLITKLGSANIFLKNLFPRWYCFHDNYLPHPTIQIK